MTQYVSRAGDPSLYLTNTQTATKIDIFEYNGTEPGKYSNTSQPLPSQYQFLNIWNFSTFRIRIVDREGRTLAEVPQKSTNYFNSRIGAPSSDLYFTIYWDQDYTAEGMENFNIEGSYFRVVGSDVPLLEPTSLLADMLAIQQGDNIQHIVDEGIMVESKVPYPSRFTFTEGEELEDLSEQFLGPFTFCQKTKGSSPAITSPYPPFFEIETAFGIPLSFTSDGPIPWTGITAHKPQFVNNVFYYSAHDLAYATIHQLCLQAFAGNNSSWEEIFLNLEKMKAQIENTIEIKGAEIPCGCVKLHEPAQNLFDINVFFTGDFNFGAYSVNSGNGNDENLVLLPKQDGDTVTVLQSKDMINTTRWRRSPVFNEIEQPIFYFIQCSTNEPSALEYNNVNYTMRNGYGACVWTCLINITLSAKKQRDYMPIFYQKALEYYANNDLAGYNNYILHYLNNIPDFFTEIIKSEYDAHSGFWQTLANNYMARFIYDENHFNPQKQMFGINEGDYYFDTRNVELAVLNGEVYVKLYTTSAAYLDYVYPLQTNKKYNKLVIEAQNICNHNGAHGTAYNVVEINVYNTLRAINYNSVNINGVMHPQKIEIPLEQLDCNFNINIKTNPTDPANANLCHLTNSDIYIVGEDYYKEV